MPDWVKIWRSRWLEPECCRVVLKYPFDDFGQCAKKVCSVVVCKSSISITIHWDIINDFSISVINFNFYYTNCEHVSTCANLSPDISRIERWIAKRQKPLNLIGHGMPPWPLVSWIETSKSRQTPWEYILNEIHGARKPFQLLLDFLWWKVCFSGSIRKTSGIGCHSIRKRCTGNEYFYEFHEKVYERQLYCRNVQFNSRTTNEHNFFSDLFINIA